MAAADNGRISKGKKVTKMSESEFAAMLRGYLCDARTRAAGTARDTLAGIATIGNVIELAGRVKEEPLSVSQGA